MDRASGMCAVIRFQTRIRSAILEVEIDFAARDRAQQLFVAAHAQAHRSFDVGHLVGEGVTEGIRQTGIGDLRGDHRHRGLCACNSKSCRGGKNLLHESHFLLCPLGDGLFTSDNAKESQRQSLLSEILSVFSIYYTMKR